jgi:hypothetical protein
VREEQGLCQPEGLFVLWSAEPEMAGGLRGLADGAIIYGATNPAGKEESLTISAYAARRSKAAEELRGMIGRTRLGRSRTLVDWQRSVTSKAESLPWSDYESPLQMLGTRWRTSDPYSGLLLTAEGKHRLEYVTEHWGRYLQRTR